MWGLVLGFVGVCWLLVGRGVGDLGVVKMKFEILIGDFNGIS